jgi:hypothetical protein
MKFEVLKRHILKPRLSVNMVQQVLRLEGQKKCSNEKGKGAWQRDDVIIKF